ncbi:MAG: hypothetical protein OXF79_10535, partial [Chloroflexi bacterium]|nr:hypothetical protein [Chloroflexota bacterium]
HRGFPLCCQIRSRSPLRTPPIPPALAISEPNTPSPDTSRQNRVSSYLLGTTLEARMSGPHYGTTVVQITIGPLDYQKILKAMVKTDRKTALRAMARVLAQSVG